MFCFYRVTLYAEFLPSALRARCLIYVEVSLDFYHFRSIISLFSDILGHRSRIRSRSCPLHHALIRLESSSRFILPPAPRFHFILPLVAGKRTLPSQSGQ